MGKTTVVVRTGTDADFFRFAKEAARRLDAEKPASRSVTLVFEDPARMLAVLSGERRRLIGVLLKAPQTVAQLTKALKRDRAAVTKDVRLLESAGLVHTERCANPGHGVNTLVAPVASRIELVATLA